MEVEPTMAAKAKMSLDILNNEIVKFRYKIQHILPIVLEVDAKVHHGNEWRTYHDRNSLLEKKHVQAYYMIQGQCMQVILDKMNHDQDWGNISESYDPRTILKLIEKTILAQTED